jgi:DNA invertase Pin-like site-specific DNA recombinase
MGRLTLNVLLSFAQFEREVAGERIRDKIVASKKKGMWVATCRSATTRANARASSTLQRPRPCAGSSPFISISACRL